MMQQSRRAIGGIVFLSLLPSFLYALFRFSMGVALPEIAGEFRLDSGQAGGIGLSIASSSHRDNWPCRISF